MSDVAKTAEPSPAEGAKRPGRVKHDSRGNAVWDWAIATGVLATATIEDLLHALAPPERVTIELENGPATRFAGDPYNRSAFRVGGARR